MTIITLLTDFGLKDGYVGIMKGVIWGIAPQVKIADLSHTIQPQDIMQGALALARTVPYFPPGTIHVAVVDPGVGTLRRPLALRLGDQLFVGPDNGLFTAVLERAQSNHMAGLIVYLNRPEYWLADISRVFHGRDIFAPVAAQLAKGIALEALGVPVKDPVRLTIPSPQPTSSGGWLGEVVEIDNFGNLSTNLTRQHLASLGTVRVQIAGQVVVGLVNTFADQPEGTLIALYGTANDLVIAKVNGSAATQLGVFSNEPVEVIPIRVV